MIVTQVVRRFGRVGGMESYVWFLCKHLLKARVHLNLICEDVIDEMPDLSSSNVWTVDKPLKTRPRWKAMRHFQFCVEHLIRNTPREQWGIIHSHERLNLHDVTTIHGPLMGNPDSLGFFRNLNGRIQEWSVMERDEVSGSNVRAVFCVSDLAREKLKREYPDAPISSQIMWPGIDLSSVSCFTEPKRSLNNVFFVGKEWRRKGLAFAIQIVKGLRKHLPEICLHVYGPTLEELPWSMRSFSWVKVHGFQTPPYETCGLLVHPAIDEPFGMVISEARAHGAPCLISDRVGATGIEFNYVRALGLDESIDSWIASGLQLLESSDYSPEIRWTWDDLANVYCRAFEALQ